MKPNARRLALSQFLKDRRAQISPAEAGLPDTARRRAPGLRREDVAALSGVSLTWYTRLEQGHAERVSAQVLERVAAALRMNAVEREYLFELAHDRPAPLPSGDLDEVTPAMERMLAGLGAPAYITTMRWDVVAWNPMCAAVLRDYSALEERNLLRILFAGEGEADDPEEFASMARRLVAKLRVDYSQFPGDPVLEALVAELAADYPAFRALWDVPQITAQSEGISTARHAELGEIRLQHSSYMPEGCPTLRIVIFAPYDAESAAKLARIRDALD